MKYKKINEYLIFLENMFNSGEMSFKKNFSIIFICLNNFKKVKSGNKISYLLDFQSMNKYLFMAFSPEKQVKLGNILANYKKNNIENIKKEYYKELLELLNTKTSKGKFINSLSHIFGYFKQEYSNEEKIYFMESLEKYKDGKINISCITKILKKMAIKYKKNYILKQTLINIL